jgi:hypothetical protein
MARRTVLVSDLSGRHGADARARAPSLWVCRREVAPGAAPRPLEGSEEPDQAGRLTGTCPVCHGRLRLDIDGLLPNHGPAPKQPRYSAPAV